MTDACFFKSRGPFSVKDIVTHLSTDSDPVDLSGNADVEISDVNTLKEASASDLTFFHNKKYIEDLKSTRAGAVVVAPEFVKDVPEACSAIVSSAPYRTYAQAAHYLYPDVEKEFETSLEAVHPDAKIASDVILEPGVVVKAHAEIAPGCAIGANTVIGRGVKISKNTRIGANVTISHCLIGESVTILPGTRIGQAGFGFHMDEKGYVSVPQLGRVFISDKVEIGSNVTIDRGALEDTFIGYGTRIDNLVQIGHGVKLGKYCVIVSQVGISGSTHFGDYVIAAGQAGFAGHLNIGTGVQIAAKGGVMRDIEPGQKVAGYPAVPVRQWHKQNITLAKMAGGATPGRDKKLAKK